MTTKIHSGVLFITKVSPSPVEGRINLFNVKVTLYVRGAKICIDATSQYRERPLAKAPLATARGTDPVDALRNPDLGVPDI